MEDQTYSESRRTAQYYLEMMVKYRLNYLLRENTKVSVDELAGIVAADMEFLEERNRQLMIYEESKEIFMQDLYRAIQNYGSSSFILDTDKKTMIRSYRDAETSRVLDSLLPDFPPEDLGGLARLKN